MNTYIIRFFSNFALAGFYPFLSVWLAETTEMSALKISIIISIGIFMSRVGSVIFSKWISFYNKRTSIFFSSFLIILIVGLMTLCKRTEIETLWAWVPLAMLWGVFVSIITLALFAFVADQFSGEEQKSGFSHLNIALSMSSGVGPIAGSVALAYYPELLPLVPVMALAFSILFTFRMPKDKHKTSVQTHTGSKKSQHKNEYAPFLVLCVINFLTFMSYSQFINIYPMYANQFIDKKLVGLFFFISSVVIAVTQIPLNKFFAKVETGKTMMIACLIAGIGSFLFIGTEKELISLCVMGVVFFSIAQAMYTPLYQQIGVEIFPGNSTYALALIMLMWGLGEGATVITGFYLIDKGFGAWSYLLGGTAAFLAIPLIWLYRKKWP